MSAAVEQIPPAGGAAAVFVDIDLEANNATRGAAAVGSSATEQQAAVVVAVDIESGRTEPSPGGSPSDRPTVGTLAHGDAMALLLGLVSVVCLTIVMGQLLNGAPPGPVSASLFLICAISCGAVLRRQRAAAAASRALERSATVLSMSHHPHPPSTLDHEARRSLFDYFVFSHPTADRCQEKDGGKDSSSELQGSKTCDGKEKEEEEEEEESAKATSTVSVVAAATATAAPVAADVKVPPSEETGMPRGTPKDWTTAVACVVCFGEYAPGDNLCRLPCRHTYHAKCIDQWLDKANHPCCPMCKADLLALHHESSGGTVATTASDTANSSSSSSSSDHNDNSINNNNIETSQPPADSLENTVSA